MRIAIVHDYIKEFGGAERVLKALCETYPDAPIYTAFVDKNSSAFSHFKNRKIHVTWFGYLPFASKLASPLRFLTPVIWGSVDLSKYDIVISSASWYVTKGFKKDHDKFVEFCYCHTPPRWLYGYATSVNYQKYAIVRIYATIVGHFMRMYDFKHAQKVDFFIANSKETQKRIEKFYRRDSKVIYPPVTLPKIDKVKKENYYFMVSRIVGAKGLELAVDAAVKSGFKLKIAGSKAGYYSDQQLRDKSKGKVEFLGQVNDEKLARLYANARGFLALSIDEDFGITPVEAMMAGTPVIAFNGGGYKESIVNGKTGILFDDYSIKGLTDAINKFEKIKFDSRAIINHAQKFSKYRFEKEIKSLIKIKLD